MDNEQITLPTNTIVLEKDKTYIFVFDQEKTGLDVNDVQEMLNFFDEKGYSGFGVLLKNAEGLTVIEKEI
ncbi:MAG TPA: hypothetical protein VF941_11995 [Clostridia bacterium]